MMLPVIGAAEWTAVSEGFFATRPQTFSAQTIDKNLFWKSIQAFPFYPTFGGQLWNFPSLLPPLGDHSFASLLTSIGYVLPKVLLAGHSHRLFPWNVYGIAYRFSNEDSAIYFVADADCLMGIVSTAFVRRLSDSNPLGVVPLRFPVTNQKQGD